ncbi:MAG: hypothetical protein R3C49_01210 [Planctomycetaceae bacterium]
MIGGTAYVADYSGLRVLDVSDPANITELGFFDTPGFALSVQVIGGTAYVADLASGLRVLDVGAPASITELGFFDTPGFAYDVQVIDSTAYVADGSEGLRVLDERPGHHHRRNLSPYRISDVDIQRRKVLHDNKLFNLILRW